MRNAAIPIVTIIGLQFGGLLGGAVITETVFAWPGVGRLAVNAVQQRDFPVVQAVTVVIAFAFSLINLTVDLLYARPQSPHPAGVRPCTWLFGSLDAKGRDRLRDPCPRPPLRARRTWLAPVDPNAQDLLNPVAPPA